MKYKRILLKLSGESLQGSQKYGLSPEVLQSYAEQIKAAAGTGVQIGIVIGGGNIFRGLTGAKKGFDRVKGDQMGMLATVINALAVEDALCRLGQKATVFTAQEMNRFARLYTAKAAIECMENGEIVLLAGGTGNPFFSTDTGAALRAAEIEADVILKATMVDGVYDSDPKKNPNAKKYDTLSYMDVLNQNLGVMDMTAASFCKDRNIPFLVFSIEDPENIVRAVSGEKVGTLVQ